MWGPIARDFKARWLGLVVFGLALTAIALPQESKPGAPSPVIKVEVKQVLVPVIVTDRKGHYVTGLKASDFQVFEDGVPQALAAFNTQEEGAASLLQPEPATPGQQPAASSPGPPAETNSSVRQTYFICLDTLNSAFENFAQVRDALRKLFKQERSADSQYALLALGRYPVIVRNLTREAASMLEALNGKELARAIQHSESTNLIAQEAELSRMLAKYCQRCPCAGGSVPSSRTSGGTGQVCSGEWGKIEMWAGAAVLDRNNLARDFLGQLRSLVEQLANQPGKRHLIFVSDGFSMRPGRDLFGLMAVYSDDPGELLRNPVESLESEIQTIIRLATAHNVAFYTLDSKGLYSVAGGGYDATGEYELTRSAPVLLPRVQQQKETNALDTQAPLGELAAATGGVFFHSSNDLFKGMRQSFADGREYYVLAYVPTNPAADGKFREIKVQVKSGNVLVRAKRGYWATPN
jgi:VWFA-related protein